MKILVLSPNIPSQKKMSVGYCGGGWISSLIYHLKQINNIHLGVGFVTEQIRDNFENDGIKYFPIYKASKSRLGKIFYYWRGYKSDIFNKSVTDSISSIIECFKPDIIHIFGTESDLPYIVEKTSVPCVIHIQGILSSFQYSYFPMGIGKMNLMLPTNVKEFWLRNGLIFNFNRMKLAAEREITHIKRCKNFIGRTDWDNHVVKMYNSAVNYFHVDELLRLPFYEAKKWSYNRINKNIIVSTLSPTIYKGLDIILKTAEVLKEEGHEFEWHVIGCSNVDRVVKIIEDAVEIEANNVNVYFQGIQTADELVNTLLGATMYVHPSYCDNSPNSLAEAQFLGIPTIATNIGGIPTLMNHCYEWMVSPTDIHTLAIKILKLQNLLQEGNYKNDIYPIVIERHNPDKIINSLLSTYKTLLSSSK
jgi:glycosyltransferase involved in cell wall biosynthesis